MSYRLSWAHRYHLQLNFSPRARNSFDGFSWLAVTYACVWEGRGDRGGGGVGVPFYCHCSVSFYSNFSRPCVISGNGRMAVSVNSVNGLFIRLNRALSLPVKYWPLVFTNIKKERTLGSLSKWKSVKKGIHGKKIFKSRTTCPS